MSTKSTSGLSRAHLVAPSRAILLAVGAAVSVGTMSHRAEAQFLWTGMSSGNFSAGANWQGSSPPTSGLSTTLTFNNNTGAITASQDISASFQTNSITFNGAFNTTVAALPTTNVIQLAGTTPSLNWNGLGSPTVSSPVQLAGNLSFGGTGVGNLTITGKLSDDGGARSMSVNAIDPSLTGTVAGEVFHTVVVGSGTSSYTGGLTINGGNIGAAGFGGAAAPLGAAGATTTVTSNGGVLQVVGALSSGTGCTLQLNGTLRVIGGTPSSLPQSAVAAPFLSGSGELLMQGHNSAELTLVNANSGFTGKVVINQGDLPMWSSAAGGISLSGAASGAGGSTYNYSGSMLGVPEWDVSGGGTLRLNSTTAGTQANGNRISPTAPLNFNSSIFVTTGAASAVTAGTNFTPVSITENVGPMNGAGYNTITCTPGTGVGTAGSPITTTLSFASLNRVQRGTFLFNGIGLGDNTNTLTAEGNIKFATAPTGDLVGGGGASGGTNISILPYAIGDSSNQSGGAGVGTAGSLVTIDPVTGIRPLTNSEYEPDLLMTNGATANARLTTNVTNSGTATVNALVVAAGGGISGSGTLNVTSGAIINGNSAGIVTNNLSFGSTEANVFSAGTASSVWTLVLTGNLTGSNGFTKSGNGQVVLTGNNSGLTGQLTLNAGLLSFNSNLALPGTGQIIVNGSAAAGTANSGGGTILQYAGSAPVTMPRDIAVNGGLLCPNSPTAGDTLTLSGTISGAGGVYVSTTADVFLSGNNTYTGITYLGGGTVHISSDSNLGNGGAVGINTGTLQTDGNWTTSRMVNFSAAGTINTNGNNVALNGPLTSYNTNVTLTATDTLTKTGLGTLAINSNLNQFIAPVIVNGGTLLVNGTLGSSTTAAITINANATLGGSGSIIHPVSIAASGTLWASAGQSLPSVLSIYGTLTSASGSNFNALLNGSGVGNYDQIIASGAITLTGTNLATTLGYGPSASDTFWILVNNGTSAITGTFAGLAEGATVSLGSFGGTPYTAQISYLGNYATQTIGTGHSVVLYGIVPAPASAAVLAFGGLFAARRRRNS